MVIVTHPGVMNADFRGGAMCLFRTHFLGGQAGFSTAAMARSPELAPPAAGIAGRVAAGAGWPGRTEILRFRRWAWVCHLGFLSGASTG